LERNHLTTYAKWCELFGFKYHCIATTKKPFPDEWLKEVQEKTKWLEKKLNTSLYIAHYLNLP
jgi:hypothetical protein